MIPLLFTSVEFYVVAFIIAAAIIALSVKPASRGQAETIFVKGVLDCDSSNSPAHPEICLKVNDDNSVTLIRKGLDDVTDTSAVTLVITKISFNLQIKERVASLPGQPVNQAVFSLDFLAPERYHITYQAENSERFTAFSLLVKPGISFCKTLNQ